MRSLLDFFEREESIRKSAWCLTLARIGDCDARVAVLNFHSGCSNRDASCNIAPLFIVPCADLPTVNAASIPTFKKPSDCFPNTLRRRLRFGTNAASQTFMHQPGIHGIYQLLYQGGIRPVLLISDCAEIVFPVSVKSPDTLVIP